MLRRRAGSLGGAAALMLAVCGVLFVTEHMQQKRTELTTYQPASLRWPGWMDSFPEAKPAANAAPPPAAPRLGVLVGAPDDWRDNINYGFHPDEAKVPQNEAQDAMQTLINAAGGGETVPAAEAAQAARRQRVQSERIVSARVEESKGASPQQLARILNPSPCEENPSDLRCSEYPTGALTPEYDKAKFGPSIKVPNGAIRNVEGSAEDTDGRRRSAPESEYDYEVRSLTANYQDQESPQRRVKDGYHDRIDAEDPMGKEENQKLVPLNTYEKARFGPGIKMLDMQRAADNQVPRLQSTQQRAVPEYWKARYGADGVYPFRKGDSDATMSYNGQWNQKKTDTPRQGQEYFKVHIFIHMYTCVCVCVCI